MTKEQRIEKMLVLRAAGYNCAQSLLMCFTDITGLDEDTSARVTGGMGRGVGGIGELCGAANAMAVVAGCMHGPDAASKADAAADACTLCKRFAEENGGRIICRELKAKAGVRPCNELIAQAMDLLCEKYLR